MSQTIDALLAGDPVFCDWANRYLRQMAEEACIGTWKLLTTLEGICARYALDMPEPEELDLMLHSYMRKGHVDIRRSMMKQFVTPLRYLYELKPNIIAPVREREPSFVDWATEYLKKLWTAVIEPLDINAELTDWGLMDEFYDAMNAVGCTHINLRSMPSPLKVDRVDVDGQAYKPIRQVLEFLYKKHECDKTARIDRLLRRFYNEVVSTTDKDQRNEYLQAAVSKAANATLPFASRDVLVDVGRFCGKMSITNPQLSLFRKPLDYLLSNTNGRVAMPTTPLIGEIPEQDARHALDDILICPEEELKVIVRPVALKSKIGTPEFEKAVRKMMGYCLQRGFQWLSSSYLAKAFQVDQRCFEEWADKNPYLQSGEGVELGVFFYRLTPLRELKKMSLFGLAQSRGKKAMSNKQAEIAEDNASGDDATEAAAATAAEEAAAPAAADPATSATIGSDEFEQQVTQFLSESKKSWRSSEVIATALSVEVAELETWLRQSPAFQSRPGGKKDEPKTYFALVCRFEEKQPVTVGSVAATNANRPETSATKKDDEKDKKNKKQRSSIRNKELLAFAMLYQLLNALVSCMAHYANSLATYHREAFTHLTQAEKELSSGVALLKSSLKVDDKKLPPPEEL